MGLPVPVELSLARYITISFPRRKPYRTEKPVGIPAPIFHEDLEDAIKKR